MSFATIRKVLMVSGCLALFAAGTAHAELKLATVDFNRLLSESIQAKATMQVLQEEFGPRERELQQKQKELQGKQDKLTRDGAVMAEKDRSTLEKELSKGQREFQGEAEAFTEEVNGRQNEERGKLQGLLVTEVRTFAKTGGYDLVLPTSITLFAKDSLDITPQVLAYLLTRPAMPPATAAKPAASGKPTK